jgi:hypothetical protein
MLNNLVIMHVSEYDTRGHILEEIVMGSAEYATCTSSWPVFKELQSHEAKLAKDFHQKL